MLDIKFIRQNQEKIKRAAEEKKLDPKLVDKLLLVDKKRSDLIAQIDQLRRERKAAAEKREVEKGRQIKAELAKLEPKLKKAEEEFRNLSLQIPNIPADNVSSNENRVVFEQGEKPKFDFKPRDHIEIGKRLDLIDIEKGAEVSGFRGYYLKNEAVLLHLGVLMYGLRKIISKGFVPMIPPTLVKEFVLVGSGHFPFGREDVYKIEGEELFLAGTSEPSLLAYFAGRVFDEKDLPVKVCGISQCYRSEIGSYGKDTKGIYRLHEFMKVEQIVFCKADLKESDSWLDKMRGYAEEILRDLKLPYRAVEVCTGDMGAGKRKMYDLETWMPGRGGYGETHSDSNLTDWQARRLNIKYRTGKGENVFVHALNNTVIASPRILIAILENYQQKDGSVLVPEVLRDFVGLAKISPKK